MIGRRRGPSTPPRRRRAAARSGPTLLAVMFAAPDHVHHRLRLGCRTGRMPFQFSPHNHYLALWFNLGPGRAVLRQLSAVLGDRSRAPRQSAGRAAAARPAHRLRARRRRVSPPPCSSWICTSRGIYFWMYTGVVMRLVLCVGGRAPCTEAGDAARETPDGAARSVWLGAARGHAHESVAGSASSGWIRTACCRARAI